MQPFLIALTALVLGCHVGSFDPVAAPDGLAAGKAEGTPDALIYARATKRLDLHRRVGASLARIPDADLPDELEGRAGSYRPIAGSIYRVRVVGDDFAQIVSDSTGAAPFGHLGGVFAPLDQLEQLEHLGRPISFTDAPLDQRVIVVVHLPEPRVLLVEGDELVQVAPAVFGRARTGAAATPLSRDHQAGLWLMRAWPSINMVPDDWRRPVRPGVGFVLSISRGAMPYGDAVYNFHSSPWHRWDELDEVPRFASDGCVNLPDARWRSFAVEGREIGFPELMFRWASASFVRPVTEASVQRPSDTSELRPAMRIHSIDRVDDLVQVIDRARARRIVAQYESLGLLPGR